MCVVCVVCVGGCVWGNVCRGKSVCDVWGMCVSEIVCRTVIGVLQVSTVSCSAFTTTHSKMHCVDPQPIGRLPQELPATNSGAALAIGDTQPSEPASWTTAVLHALLGDCADVQQQLLALKGACTLSQQGHTCSRKNLHAQKHTHTCYHHAKQQCLRPQCAAL